MPFETYIYGEEGSDKIEDNLDDDKNKVKRITPKLVVSIGQNSNEQLKDSKENSEEFIYLRENLAADDIEDRKDVVVDDDHDDAYSEYFTQHGRGSNTH